jgi:hypothetical protein
VGLSGNPQTPGTLQVTKTHSSGGTFIIDLPAEIQFTFIRVSDSAERTLVSDGELVNGQARIYFSNCMPEGIQSPLFCPDSDGSSRIPATWTAGAGTLTFNHACTDGDLDGVANCGVDNCPSVANPGQEDADGDTTGDACELAHCTGVPNWWPSNPGTDPDCDGFNTADEVRLGTDPNDSCADTGAMGDEPDDKWPADFNDNRFVNTLDLAVYATALNKSLGEPGFDPRADLNGNNVINTLDLTAFATMLNRPCGP